MSKNDKKKETVSKQPWLPEGIVDTGMLNIEGNRIRLHKDLFPIFNEAKRILESEGIDLQVGDTFRYENVQQEQYDASKGTIKEGLVSTPDKSFHVLGKAFDLAQTEEMRNNPRVKAVLDSLGLIQSRPDDEWWHWSTNENNPKNDDNINFSSVLPSEQDTLSLPDIDFTSVIPSGEKSEIEDSLSFERALAGNQNYKKTIEMFGKGEKNRAERREWLRKNIEESSLVPEFALDSYNQSTEGIALEALKGKPVFKTLKSQGYPTSLVYDAAVHLGAMFASPTDIGLLYTGGKAGQIAYKSIEPFAKQGMKYLTKKNLITPNMAKMATEDVFKRGTAFSGAFAFWNPVRDAAMDIADAIAQSNQPGAEIFIGDSGDTMVQYPNPTMEKSLLSPKSTPSIGSPGSGRKGVPLDIALYIDGQMDYVRAVDNIRAGSKPLVDLSAIQEAEDSEKYGVALSLLKDNYKIRDMATGAGMGATLQASRLGFRYLPSPLKFTGPLAKPRGQFLTLTGEMGALSLTAPLLEGQVPDSMDASVAAGMVLASRIPGLSSKYFKRIRTKYKERPRTGPMSEEMKRRVAKAQDAETIDVEMLGSPKKRLEPGKVVPGDNKPIIIGELESYSPNELADIARRSGLSEKASRRMNDIYELVNDPIVHLKDARFLKLGVPIYEKTKSGEIILTGETVEGTDAAIRVLNRNDLPSGMATGDYMNTKIVGLPKDSPKKGVERLQQEVIPLAPATAVKMIRPSIQSTDAGIKFDVQVGQRVYSLDEFNSDLFLKFYTSQPLLKSNFEANNKRIFKSPYALTLIRRKKLKSIIKDELDANLPNIIQSDFRQAVASVANTLKHKKWLQRLSDTSKNVKSDTYRVPLNVDNMSEMEMKLVTERMEDMRSIRRHVDYIIENLESNSLRHVVKTEGTNEILNLLAPYVGQLGNEMTSPAAVTLLGLLSKVDRNIVERVTGDIVNLQVALGMDKEVLSLTKIAPTFISKAVGYNPFRNEISEKWITGKGIVMSDGKSYSAFNDYMKLSDDKTANRIFGQWKRKSKDMMENPGKYNYTPEEINFFAYRIKTIEAIKRITDDIARRALEAGIQVPGIKKFYMPFVMDRKFREVIYSSMQSLNKKVTKIMGAEAFGTNAKRIYASLTPEKRDAVKAEIAGWIDRLNKSKDKFKKGTAATWEEAERELKKIPGNVGPMPELDVWLAMNTSLFNEGFKTYGHLEKKRTLMTSGGGKDIDILAATQTKKMDLLDKNALTLFTDYALGANKRIELVKMFGLDGKLIDKLMDLIPDEDILSGPAAQLFKNQADTAAERAGIPPMFVSKQKDALQVIKDLITGESQYTRHNQLSSYNQKAAELIFTTKISLGTAITQNYFQPFISFVPDLGIWSASRGTKGYFFDPKIKDMIQRAGPTQLSLLDELIPGARALRISTEKIVNPKDSLIQRALQEASVENFAQAAGQPFMLVNLQNKVLGAATADDYIKKMTKVLSGKQTAADKLELAIALPTVMDKVKYARNKVSYRFGLDPDMLIKHSDAILSGVYNTKEELAVARKLRQAYESYAQWTQAGRDFGLDSFTVNDPNARMIGLFKRWAKSQAYIFNDIYEFEMANGNYFIPLTLAASGLFGGYLAGRAIEWVKDQFAGEKEYLDKKYTNRIDYRGRLPKIKDVYTGKDRIFMEDLKNAMVSGGLIGMASDIALGDEPFDALKFAVTPAGWNDFWQAKEVLELLGETPFRNDTDINRQARYIMKAASPSFGNLSALLFRRINYDPWHAQIEENWREYGISGFGATALRKVVGEKGGEVPVQDEINLINHQRNKKITELVDLAFSTEYGPRKANKVEKMRSILEEWNNSAQVYKYWNGEGLNPYAIYPSLDIDPKLAEKWVKDVNENEEKYRLKQTDMRRKQKRSKF